MNIPEIKAQLEALTYDALHYDTSRPASDRYQWRTQGLKVIERGGTLIISSPGHTVVDYHGEYFDGRPYIDPRITAIAKQHSCYWKWEHWSEIALVEHYINQQ